MTMGLQMGHRRGDRASNADDLCPAHGLQRGGHFQEERLPLRALLLANERLSPGVPRGE